MIKVLVLAAAIFSHSSQIASDVFSAAQKFSNIMSSIIVRVCDDVDPGDEDTFE